uniref:Uncharacterized protein n=1 Tax=Oryza rufipogon TaxID=4529 RepID=A0A0E0RIF1_ORYRU
MCGESSRHRIHAGDSRRAFTPMDFLPPHGHAGEGGHRRIPAIAHLHHPAPWPEPSIVAAARRRHHRAIAGAAAEREEWGEE